MNYDLLTLAEKEALYAHLCGAPVDDKSGLSDRAKLYASSWRKGQPRIASEGSRSTLYTKDVGA